MKRKKINVKEVMQECIEDMNKIGIYPEKIDGISFFDTKKDISVASCIKCSNMDLILIKINEQILKTRKINMLKGLLAHELLHAVKGCKNHDKKFVELANKINSNYDYDPLFIPHLYDFYRDDNEIIGISKCPVCGLYENMYEIEPENITYRCGEHNVIMKKILF